jgi:predicted DNA-binding transcriptional regulator AlpA
VHCINYQFVLSLTHGGNQPPIDFTKETFAMQKILWSCVELKEMTGLANRTIWGHISPRGSLRCVRVGRRVLFRPQDVNAWIEKMQQEAEAAAVA